MAGRLGRLSHRHRGPRIRADGVTRLTLRAASITNEIECQPGKPYCVNFSVADIC